MVDSKNTEGSAEVNVAIATVSSPWLDYLLTGDLPNCDLAPRRTGAAPLHIIAKEFEKPLACIERETRMRGFAVALLQLLSRWLDIRERWGRRGFGDTADGGQGRDQWKSRHAGFQEQGEDWSCLQLRWPEPFQGGA